MTKTYFITGTDTNIGKTTVTQALMLKARLSNEKVLGLKPVASGCKLENGVLYNEDGLLLQKASNLEPLYTDINPYRFLQPVSPHLVNTNKFSAHEIAESCITTISKYNPDICYIEGAGGWLCPLNDSENFSDIVKSLNIPVILVVGIKLGCLNHAILTVESIIKNNIHLHGWIANNLSPPDEINIQNINYLIKNISAPLLDEIQYNFI